MTMQAQRPQRGPAEPDLQQNGVLPREPEKAAELRFSGLPLAVRFDGRVWPVEAEPVHWFSRWDWWNQKVSAAVGVGDLVSVEHWQLQVRGGSTSTLQTLHLRRNPQETDWTILAMTDDLSSTESV